MTSSTDYWYSLCESFFFKKFFFMKKVKYFIDKKLKISRHETCIFQLFAMQMEKFKSIKNFLTEDYEAVIEKKYERNLLLFLQDRFCNERYL